MTSSKVAARLAAALATPALALALGGCAGPLSAVSGVVSALAGPAAPTASGTELALTAPAATTPTVREAGTLVVGLPSDSQAPMCVTGSDGTFRGYNVDVAAAIAERLGLVVRYVSVGSAADASSCDVVMGAEAGSAEGMQVVGSYAESATAFFHKGAQAVASPADLAGKRVGVQEGSSSLQLLKRSDLTATPQTYANLNDAFEALEAGSVDYVLCDALAGAYLQGGYDDISLAGTIDAPVGVGVAVAQSNTQLQQLVGQACDEIARDGVGDILRSKWLGGMGALGQATQVQGVTISAGTVQGASEQVDASEGASGVQDGSTAGANAASISE